MRPHVHFLGIFDKDSKPKCSAEYDRLVTAEIPDPDKCPDLYQKVKAYMLHRKCGKTHSLLLNIFFLGKKNAVDGKIRACMKKRGKCDKYFPKPFRESTRFATENIHTE